MKIGDTEIEELVVLEIGKFGILWNLFERKWFNTNFSSTKVNEDLLIKLLKKIHTKNLLELHLSINNRIKDLDHNFDGRWNAYRYVREGLLTRGLNPHNKTIMIKFITNYDDLTERERLEAGIFICYRIRCNMFHGIKDSEAINIIGLNAQRQLFNTINNFILTFVN